MLLLYTRLAVVYADIAASVTLVTSTLLDQVTESASVGEVVKLSGVVITAL